MNGTVSIIIPVYNSAKYVNKTIESVLKQKEDGVKMEVILVDDCSSDGSYKIIDQYSKGNSVKIYKTEMPSGSASRPRNIGLDHSSGDYVFFVDSDDVLKPNALAKMVQCIENHDVDLVDFAYEDVFSKKNRALNERYLNCVEGMYASAKNIEEWFDICHPIFTKLFKKEVIDKNRIRFDESLRNGEDSLFLFDYFNHIDCFWHQNEVVYEYYHRSESVSHTYDVRYHKSFFETYSAMRSWANNGTKRKYYELFLAYTLFPNLEILCDTPDIAETDLELLLDEYYTSIQNGLEFLQGGTESAFKTILYKDAVDQRKKDFLSDFYALRTIYLQRRKMIEGVTGTRGWRLIQKINSIIGRA